MRMLLYVSRIVMHVKSLLGFLESLDERTVEESSLGCVGACAEFHGGNVIGKHAESLHVMQNEVGLP
eukprot:1157255-Pelagomonas_calceolata.AAC.4